MNFVFEILFLVAIIATVFFAVCAENKKVGSEARRNYTITCIIFLVTAIFFAIMTGKK